MLANTSTLHASLSKSVRVRVLCAAFAFFVCMFDGQNIHAQTTAFSYQGVLNQNGVPANGILQMSFSLWTAQVGGQQVGATQGPIAVSVANGSFTVILDFGVSAFPGANRFLESNVSGTVLAPRPKLESVPYAVRALTVSGPVTGTNPIATLSVSNAQPGVTNPTPENLPAALRGEATSTSNSNVGLMGIANGSGGGGVMGVANGNDATGVYGLATSPTGTTTGLKAEVISPDGTAIGADITPGGTGFLFYGSNGSSTSFSVNAAGDTYINGSLSVFGSISLGNPVTVGMTPVCRDAQSRLANCSSSLRYKTDVVRFGLGIDLIKRLRPITFHWKEGGSHDLGLGAEDVAAVEPLLVTHNKDGQVEGVKYDRVGVVLINAFKEQQEQIDGQQKQIREQSEIIKRHQTQIDELKALICSQSSSAAFCKSGN